MATKKSKTPAVAAQTVSGLLEALDHPHKAGIERLRRMILSLDPRISEEIKWNAPSFRLEEHFATFKLHPPRNIQLILHTGAKVKSGTGSFAVEDPDGLLAWPSSDRCVLTLASGQELVEHEAAVRQIITQWIAQV